MDYVKSGGRKVARSKTKQIELSVRRALVHLLSDPAVRADLDVPARTLRGWLEGSRYPTAASLARLHRACVQAGVPWPLTLPIPTSPVPSVDP
jgi:hypothetical protein